VRRSPESKQGSPAGSAGDSAQTRQPLPGVLDFGLARVGVLLEGEKFAVILQREGDRRSISELFKLSSFEDRKKGKLIYCPQFQSEDEFDPKAGR
jgi:hypothetical protein